MGYDSNSGGIPQAVADQMQRLLATKEERIRCAFCSWIPAEFRLYQPLEYKLSAPLLCVCRQLERLQGSMAASAAQLKQLQGEVAARDTEITALRAEVETTRGRMHAMQARSGCACQTHDTLRSLPAKTCVSL